MVGLVGFGRWGRLIFRDLNSLGVELAVAAPSEDGRRDAMRAGAAAAVATVDDLARVGVGGAVVATPTATHAQVTEWLLRTIGGPIYVEKPLTCDVEDARRIVERGGDRVFVMDKWRYHGGIGALRDLARSGRLGRVTGLRTTRLQWGTHYRDVDGTWSLMPHDLALTREIIGVVPEPVSAAGRVDGGDADLVALLGQAPWVRTEISTRFPYKRREIVLIFEHGAAWLGDAYDDRIRLRRTDGEIEEIAISTELPLLLELRAFVGHLEGGPPPMSSAAEGAEVVEVIAACRRLAGIDPS